MGNSSSETDEIKQDFEKSKSSNVQDNLVELDDLHITDVYKYIFLNLPRGWSIKMKPNKIKFVLSTREPLSSLAVLNGIRKLSKETSGDFNKIQIVHDGTINITNGELDEYYMRRLCCIIQLLDGNNEPITSGIYKSKK